MLLNACQHPSIASVLAADETTDCVDALVDVIQMFRDIAVITCLTSDVLDRLLTSNATVLQQVNRSFCYRKHARFFDYIIAINIGTI